MNAQIQTALAPLAARMKRGTAVVRPISQVLVNLPRNEQTFARARSKVLNWMNARAGRRLPDDAWDGASFEISEIGAQRAEAVSLDEPRYWAARLDDADKDVADRTWTTEIGLAEAPDGSIVFGCKLTASMRGGEGSMARSVPGFVHGILKDIGATLDGRVISERPWQIEDRADVAQLVRLIQRKDRRVDVIVLAVPEHSSDFSQTALDASSLARRLAGTAHVAILSGQASFFLSDMVGREFSVYRSAVRTYLPGFDEKTDKPFAHPLAMQVKIDSWPGGGRDAFADALVDRALMRTVHSANSLNAVPSFLDVKQASVNAAIARAKSASVPAAPASETFAIQITPTGPEPVTFQVAAPEETVVSLTPSLPAADPVMVELLEGEVSRLQKALAEERATNVALLLDAERERDTAMKETMELRDRNAVLHARLHSYHAANRTTQAEQTVPDTLDGFDEWVAANMDDGVELHSRAYQGIKRSDYQDPALIYRTLLLLRDFYVPMRREGGPERVAAFEAECLRLGLSEDNTGCAVRASALGDEYFVRRGSSRTYLGRHFKKGTSRESRRCFRAYFFWDDQDQRAVVGWLPSHLQSRVS